MDRELDINAILEKLTKRIGELELEKAMLESQVDILTIEINKLGESTDDNS